MAYLHCHNCDWSQDDFWDKSYNPFAFLEYAWGSQLLEKNLDERFPGESMDKRTWREVLVQEAEWAVSKVKEMKYRTMEEFKKENPDRICPQCKQKELDID